MAGVFGPKWIRLEIVRSDEQSRTVCIANPRVMVCRAPKYIITGAAKRSARNSRLEMTGFLLDKPKENRCEIVKKIISQFEGKTKLKNSESSLRR